MSTEKLAKLLEADKKQLSIEQLEEERQSRHPVLRTIRDSFNLFEEFDLDRYAEILAPALEDSQEQARTVLGKIRNIIHWHKSIALSEEFVREPIDMFMANNGIIIDSIDSDILVGKFILSAESIKQIPDSVFARSFFTHYDDNVILRMGDFCYGHQVNELASWRFLENVLGDGIDPLFLEAIRDDNLLWFVSEFFNRDRGDYPEIMAFVVVE
jgi:hypothetical protein